VESTLTEVLILDGLGNDGFYKVVALVGLGFWRNLKDRAAEAHDLRASREEVARTNASSIPYLY